MSQPKKHPLGFVIDGDNLAGQLKIGMLIGGVAHKDFVMRSPETGDLFDAEADAGVHLPLSFNAQLMLRQLVRVGEFSGPFTLNMIRNLKPVDFRVLRAAQMELDALGEAEPASAPAS